jgi:hypothetical protein
MKFSTVIFAAATILIAAASAKAHSGFTKPPTAGIPCIPGAPSVAGLVRAETGDNTGKFAYRC